jgi:hypothetical protein
MDEMFPSTRPWKSVDKYSACMEGTTALEMTGFFLEAVLVPKSHLFTGQLI